jgi:hypothetical protein
MSEAVPRRGDQAEPWFAWVTPFLDAQQLHGLSVEAAVTLLSPATDYGL